MESKPILMFRGISIYPGETILSIIDRYIGHTLSSKRQAFKKLGIKSTSVSPNFPTGIGELILILCRATGFTAEHFLKNHTPLNYLSNFVAKDKQKRLIDSILNQKVVPPLGLVHSQRISLMFCPLCSKEDINKYGETFWRVVHQLPNIRVCTIHKVFLRSASLSINCSEQISPNLASNYTLLDQQVLRCENDEVMNLAEKIMALQLEKEHFEINAFREKALKMRFLKKIKNGVKVMPGVKLEFKNYLEHSEFKTLSLPLLKCRTFNEIRGGNNQTLLLLLDHYFNRLLPKEDTSLIIYALCINELCSCYGSILTSGVTYTKNPWNKRIIILAVCPNCKLIYSANLKNKNKKAVIHDYGILVRNEIKRLVQQQSLSSISRLLKIDDRAIKKMMSSAYGVTLEKKGSNKNSTVNLQQRRDEWSRELNSPFFISLTESRRKLVAISAWLQWHDSKWFKVTNQKFRSKFLLRKPFDYESLDKQCIEILERQMPNEDFLRSRLRISGSHLLRLLGKNINHLLDRLPITKQYIQENSESKFEYKERRVKRFLNELPKDSKIFIGKSLLDKKFKIFRLAPQDQVKIYALAGL